MTASLPAFLRGRRPPERPLAGLVVAITGGARGIGFTTAESLVRHGAVVAIGDVDEDAVGKAAADLGITGLPVDVTDRPSFRAFLDAVADRHGRIDVLVNNAGIMPVGRFLDQDDRILRRVIDIDLLGVVVGSQLAAQRMSTDGGGHIVNIASVAGRLPTPGLAVYNAVKAGVIEFSEALDAELAASGVRVSAVLPTFTRTALIDGLSPSPLVRTIAPGDVAAAVVATIRRPRARVTVPRSMGWVNANALLPHGVKRAARRLTGIDRTFIDVDTDLRADYVRRSRGEDR